MTQRRYCSMRGATGVFKVGVFCVSLLTGACVSSEQKAPEVSTSNSSQSSRVDFGDFAYNSMESGPRLAFFPKGRNQRSSYELIFSDPFTNTNNTAVHQFTVVPGICGNEQDRGDCRDDPSGRGLKSLRSELSENNTEVPDLGVFNRERHRTHGKLVFPLAFRSVRGKPAATTSLVNEPVAFVLI